ncbi:MAG: hypothetical protein EZS28_030765 [Streblomastix strix]|uniref:Uncharacterized protein n=1 Tax=Streblomastix strix TaxID=222440 RepID=A0A5J4UTK9_9EUKA|nr:MAG: hypothetical protein EZS28_030765 [Streblomastix strix]
MLDKAGTFIAQHHPNHIGTGRISANTFAVQMKPKTATYRKRFHFVLADTDSIYIAIAGDPNKDYIYDYKKILGFGIENERYELTSLGPKCYSMIVHKWNNEKQQFEFKPKITSNGISKSQQITHDDYVNLINKDIVKKEVNGTLKMHDNVMSSIQVENGIKDVDNIRKPSFIDTANTFIDMRRILKNTFMPDFVYFSQIKMTLFEPISANITIAIDTLEQLHIDWHAIWKAIYEAGIKFACESKLCK